MTSIEMSLAPCSWLDSPFNRFCFVFFVWCTRLLLHFVNCLVCTLLNFDTTTNYRGMLVYVSYAPMAALCSPSYGGFPVVEALLTVWKKLVWMLFRPQNQYPASVDPSIPRYCSPDVQKT